MSKLAGWSWEQEALARCEGILVIDVAGCGWMWLDVVNNGNSGWMWLEISPLLLFLLQLNF
jgi:hypothetical protein